MVSFFSLAHIVLRYAKVVALCLERCLKGSDLGKEDLVWLKDRKDGIETIVSLFRPASCCNAPDEKDPKVLFEWSKYSPGQFFQFELEFENGN